MVAGDDVAVEAEADHQQESAVPRPTRRRPGPGRPSAIVLARASGSRRRPKCWATRFSVPAGKTVSGHARPFVEQGRDRAVTADGDQAAATPGRGPLGSPAPIAPRASRRSPRATDTRASADQSLDQAQASARSPSSRLATMPTQAHRSASAIRLASAERRARFLIGDETRVCSDLLGSPVASSTPHRQLA